MTKAIVGIFDEAGRAEEAVRDLINVGIERENISLIRGDRGRSHQTRVTADRGMAAAEAADSAGTARVMEAEGGMTDDSETDAGAAAAGAGAGAVVGAGAALLAGAAGLFIPGLGLLLGIGPLAATILGGAGIGAVAGGLTGALVHHGVPESQAADYAEGVRRGGTLVLVRVEDDDEDRAISAADVLSGHGAYDIQERASTWRQPVTAPEPSRFDDELTDIGGDDWTKAEPEARSRWQRSHPDVAWDSVRDSARSTWEMTRHRVR